MTNNSTFFTKLKDNIFLQGFMMLALFAAPPLLIFLVNYFQYDSQLEGDRYKVAFENKGKLYELSITGSSFAFDKGTNNDQLYLNAVGSLADLIALSYNDFNNNQTGSPFNDSKIEQTDNPFFAGKIIINNSQKYYDQTTKYSTPKDSYQTYTFYDQNRNQILLYDPTVESEFVFKIRPTFPMFSKSRYSAGGYKQNYVNVTKLFKEKLNKNLKIRTDEANKLLIISFEN